MKFNEKDLLTFKHFFHGKETATFQTFKKRDKDATGKAGIYHLKLTKRDLAVLRNENERGLHIGMMINRGDGKGRTAANVSKVVAVFVDDDGTCGKERLLASPIKFHMITETSHKHYQAFVRAKLKRSQAKEVMQMMAGYFGTDPSVCDLARVMRPAGTLNVKHDPPYQVKIRRIDKDAEPVSYKELVAAFGKAGDSMSGDEAVPAPTAASGATNLIPRLKASLERISAQSRAVWWKVGAAIHAAFPNELGFDIFTTWSKTAPDKFDADDQRQTWDSYQDDAGIGLGTIFWMASRAEDGVAAPVTDVDFAELLAFSAADRLRFNLTKAKWMALTDGKWSADPYASRRIVHEMVKAQDTLRRATGGREALGRFMSASGQKAILSAAEIHQRLGVRQQDFDRDENLLGTGNGVVDLSTGVVRPIVPDDLISRSTGTIYDPTARCPSFRAFIKDVSNDDPSLMALLQTLAGCGALGHSREQIAAVACGSGANGKGVFLRTLKKVLGEYAHAPSPTILHSAYKTPANAPMPAVLQLAGCRLMVVTEVQQDRPLDHAFIKQLAGGDPITCRTNYSEPETFTPICLLFLSVNKMPAIPYDDDAMWRRILPVPFDRSYNDEDRDVDLEIRLEAELPGILNWVIEGARMYVEGGLPSCKRSAVMKDALRAEADTPRSWLKARCQRDADARTPADALLTDYREFTKARGFVPLNPHLFASALKKRGLHHGRTATHNYWAGVRLRG